MRTSIGDASGPKNTPGRNRRPFSGFPFLENRRYTKALVEQWGLSNNPWEKGKRS